jgi:hypothetical protein
MRHCAVRTAPRLITAEESTLDAGRVRGAEEETDGDEELCFRGV